MQISNISQHNCSFQAKFMHSQDLKDTVEYAIAHNKFDKLNRARKNIDSTFLTTRLLMNLDTTPDGRAIVRFSKFLPKNNVIVPRSPDDYRFVKTTEYISDKPQNPLKFAMEKIIKMGNDVPKNKIFKKTVMSNK